MFVDSFCCVIYYFFLLVKNLCRTGASGGRMQFGIIQSDVRNTSSFWKVRLWQKVQAGKRVEMCVAVMPSLRRALSAQYRSNRSGFSFFHFALQRYFVFVRCNDCTEENNTAATADWEEEGWRQAGELSALSVQRSVIETAVLENRHIASWAVKLWCLTTNSCNREFWLLWWWAVFQGTSVSEGDLMPEEFYIVRNKGLQSLELYEEWVCLLLSSQSAFFLSVECYCPPPCCVCVLQCVHRPAAGWRAEATCLPITVRPIFHTCCFLHWNLWLTCICFVNHRKHWHRPDFCRNRPGRKWYECGQETMWLYVFCVFRKPSGRQEVVQLMRTMDDMLLKAGVDERTEELKDISQVRRQQLSV